MLDLLRGGLERGITVLVHVDEWGFQPQGPAVAGGRDALWAWRPARPPAGPIGHGLRCGRRRPGGAASPGRSGGRPPSQAAKRPRNRLPEQRRAVRRGRSFTADDFLPARVVEGRTSVLVMKELQRKSVFPAATAPSLQLPFRAARGAPLTSLPFPSPARERSLCHRKYLMSRAAGESLVGQPCSDDHSLSPTVR
ncbi:Protein of unknown function [Gryllus bimaculatus]|nr:Protein of unknown function [Gryllus bimaculatus]